VKERDGWQVGEDVSSGREGDDEGTRQTIGGGREREGGSERRRKAKMQ
jgi:hypothetical protein